MSNHKKHDLAIIIGRFQPIHSGHIRLIEKAKRTAKHVLILLGTCNSSRTFKNPWTSKERTEMISQVIDTNNVHFGFLEDYLYNDNQWCRQVQSTVFHVAEDIGADTSKIALIGFKKDDSSYYLDLFPSWDYVELEQTEAIEDLNATNIRNCLFSYGRSDDPAIKKHFLSRDMGEKLSTTTIDYICEWINSPIGQQLQEEFLFIRRYKEQWDCLPYPPTFNCSDAVVFCGGHVLMIVRKAKPGKGLYALPGGFINPNETGLESAIRELREETKLKVPVPVLKGSQIGNKVFDHPDRSLRGRTFSHAYAFNVKSGGSLPKVKGGDDAKHATWIPLSHLRGLRPQIFEDHVHIIHHFLAFL